MGACNQGGKVLEFLWWGRHRRHSLGFSETAKMEILIFRFCRYRGFRGEAPNAVIGFFPMVKCALRELVFRVVSEKRVSVHYFTAIQK